MKRGIITVLALIFLFGAVLAESDTLLRFYTEMDWFSRQAADEALLPDGLTEREAEIYRAAYANGHYDALHPAFQEGVYMLNKKTKKFHLTNCMTTLMIESENREYSTLSPEELMNKGFKPCKQCNPERNR